MLYIYFLVIGFGLEVKKKYYFLFVKLNLTRASHKLKKKKICLRSFNENIIILVVLSSSKHEMQTSTSTNKRRRLITPELVVDALPETAETAIASQFEYVMTVSQRWGFTN